MRSYSRTVVRKASFNASTGRIALETQVAPASCIKLRRFRLSSLANLSNPLEILKTDSFWYLIRNPDSLPSVHAGTHSLRREPLIQSLPNKLIVVKVRISLINTVDLLCLSGAKGFMRVQAPDPFQQTLPSQNFV